MNEDRCDVTDLPRATCQHCREAGDVTALTVPTTADYPVPPVHHQVPRTTRVRPMGRYVTRPWAGVRSAGDQPAGFINCDGDGHVHPDTFICSDCFAELVRHLTDVPALVDDLNAALIKDVRFPERGLATDAAASYKSEEDYEHQTGKQLESPVNFNVAARAAMAQIRDALVYPSEADRAVAAVRPFEFARHAARWMLTTRDWTRDPNLNDTAGAISRACVHARQVIDRPREIVYYGVCPQCGGDIYQERVDKADRDAMVTCQHGCGYSERYTLHEQAAIEAGENRWLTVDELVGTLLVSADELVSRKQLERWIAFWIRHEGLARETRQQAEWVDGTLQQSADEVYVYRLGDVRQRVAQTVADRGAMSSAEVALRLGVRPEYVKVLVSRGALRPLREGAKPLRFSEATVEAYEESRRG